MLISLGYVFDKNMKIHYYIDQNFSSVCREGPHDQSRDVRVSRVYALIVGFRAIVYFLAGDTTDEIPYLHYDMGFDASLKKP